MTGEELWDARNALDLSVSEMADALKLGDNGSRAIRRMERGEKPISGPMQVAIAAMLLGFTFEAPEGVREGVE